MSASTAPPTNTLADDPVEPSRQQASRLLDLPPELRNRIYSYLLESSQGIRFRGVRKWTNFRYFQPSILATCRSVHAEATPILYGANKFEVSGDFPDEAFRRFRASIPLLRYVKIIPNGYTYLPQVLIRLGAAIELERLEITCHDELYASEAQTPTLDDEEWWSEDNAVALFDWVSAQRKGRTDKKKDPIDVLKLSCSCGEWETRYELLAEKLAWKLEYGWQHSKGYEAESENAAEDLKTELDRVKEKAEKLVLKLRGLVEEE